MSLTPRLVNRLRLKHWALLRALGDTPTLSEAAARVNMTQPAATKLLADLEQAFGFPLFERMPRGIRATTLGLEVIAYARRAQAGLERFLEDLDDKRRGGHGLLVFGAIMGAAPDLVARAVNEIKRERPRLTVRIVGETSDQITRLLERHEIELVVGRFTDPLQHNDFDFTPLADETLLAVVRRRHRLVAQRRVTLAELAQWPWILQALASPARQLLEEELSRVGVGTPENAVECTSIFATLQLVQSSDAIAVLPESVVRDHVRAKLLAVLPVEIGRSLGSFGLIRRKDEPLSEVAAAFAGHLRREASGARAQAARPRPIKPAGRARKSAAANR